MVDAIGIGVNGIVGSGIYLLVAPLARVGGGSSVAGVLGCGALCVLIALCFAELSSMYDRSGGPYVYARDGDALTPSQTLARVVDCERRTDEEKGGGRHGLALAAASGRAGCAGAAGA